MGLDPRAEGLRLLGLFSALCGLRGREHCLDWIIAGRGLSRQHHRIRPIEDCICNIEDFSPGRHRIRNHRLHHLSGRDHRTVQGTGARNDFLLYADQAIVTDFHTQITPSDHHSVTCGYKIIQSYIRCDCFRPLNFGNQISVGAALFQSGPRKAHVLGISRERDRYKIGVDLGHHIHVSEIFIGQSGR